MEVSGEDDALAPEVSGSPSGGGVESARCPPTATLWSLVGHFDPPSAARRRAGPAAREPRGGARRSPCDREARGRVRLAREDDDNDPHADHRPEERRFSGRLCPRRPVQGLTPPARAGSNEWVVAEIDESDGTIDCFSPEITVDREPRLGSSRIVTATLAELESTFAALFARTRGRPCQRHLCVFRSGSPSPPATFGRSGELFLPPSGAEKEGTMDLTLGGRFKPLWTSSSGLGAISTPPTPQPRWRPPRLWASRRRGDCSRAIPGVRRRQGVLLEEGGLLVMEDDAHHPSRDSRASLQPSPADRVPPGPPDRGLSAPPAQPHRTIQV